MDCENFQEGVLDVPTARLSLEAGEHAAECGRCADFLLDVQTIERTLSSEARAAPPPRVRRRVFEAFRELHPDEEDGWLGTLFPRLPRLALAGAAAAAVAIGVWVARGPDRPEMEVTRTSMVYMPEDVPAGITLRMD